MTNEVTIPNATLIEGRPHLADGKGRLTPMSMIKAQDVLQHEVVYKIVDFAMDLSAPVSRFKGHTFEDLSDFEAILDQEYGLTKGGSKGNKTFTSFDGLRMVKVQVADHVDFGPQLQIAKSLIDECLVEWTDDARPELRAIVTRAFNTDKAGQVNRSEIFMLLRLEIEDPRWKQAMQAIRDAMRVIGSKTYVRFFQRANVEAEWTPVIIDMAKA